ncbi:nuclear transport factor 2 family protein [Cupriavidus sp. WKF15]|uniref:nuclear transport factor 2 family protein n=1 Tax=Cupriavidus sp. WKF15 TaxID=3032282 RepID=UPI0023E13FEB|nr:nuclear transport factor 2 family protein [Cupriavidus sp. WKF15]WER48387.1 nuclear transport factor 2 family protein [Cupriavidus sp. WKF15]
MTKAQIPASAADTGRRLAALEAESAARRTLSRYMSLCDVPAPADARDGELPALFTDDAVWEGVGAEYASGFGRHAGPAAIDGFLRKYLPPVPHFQRNVHFLTSEAMVADGDVVRGHWIMQQLSVYAGGKTELISARLAVVFDIDSDGTARVRHFQTERLSCQTLAETRP